MINNIHILTVSHKEVELDKVPEYGLQCVDDKELKATLHALKQQHQLTELYHLSTCNRVIYMFVTPRAINHDFIVKFLGCSDCKPVKYVQGEKAIQYLFEVASSIHSMVVGEREIITQLRKAYEEQMRWGLTGDNIRIAVQHAIRAAKKVYANTKIGEKPVSVVSLAVRSLAKYELDQNAGIVLVGAGSTNQLILRHLTKAGFRNISIYNRTLARAQTLAKDVKGKVGTLDELVRHDLPFKCLIACTGAPNATVSYDMLKEMMPNDLNEIVWIDLGLPADLDEQIQAQFSENLISLQSLQALSKENVGIRQQEIKKADEILSEALEGFKQTAFRRRIEKAFILIPEEIKEIKEKAMTEVFRRDMEEVDTNTRALIDKMMNYMEKKCISIPMKAAREARL